MSRRKRAQFNFQTGEEVVDCNHCWKKGVYHVEYHYELCPKTKDGRIVVPLEMVERKIYDVPPPIACDDCIKFPKCKSCEIILCDFEKHYHSQSAKENPEYCKRCWEFKNEKKSTGIILTKLYNYGII